MYRLFLAGGTASGKSSAARYLAQKGALRIDLDQLSRAVLAPGEPCVREIADVFGSDLVDPATGILDRHLLAERAFKDAASTKRLEDIELPHITGALKAILSEGQAEVAVVEIPLLDRAESYFDEADEIACVITPLALRRERAIARGMDGADFDHRVAQQPTDAYLEKKADTVFRNDGDEDALRAQLDAWWKKREAAGWQGSAR